MKKDAVKFNEGIKSALNGKLFEAIERLKPGILQGKRIVEEVEGDKEADKRPENEKVEKQEMCCEEDDDEEKKDEEKKELKECSKSKKK